MAYAKKKQPTENRVVKWLMQDKKIIKFQDDDTTYKLKGKVAEFDHVKYGVKTGVSVEVAIDGDSVTFMKKSENQQATEKEVVKETKSQTVSKTSLNGDHSVWTISGVPTSKEVIAFKEGKVKWYQVSDEIKEKDWSKEGFIARARVKVKIGNIEIKGEQKPCVLEMEVLNEEGKDDDGPKETRIQNAEENTFKNNSEQVTGNINLLDNPSDTWQVKQLKNKINYLLEVKQSSIERQSCWSSACEVISSMIQGGVITVDESEIDNLKTQIEKLAEAGLAFVRKV